MGKKQSIFLALGIFYLAMLSLTMIAYGRYMTYQAVEVENAVDICPVFVIDAGHGGEDGGTVSPDGDKESDINLSIAQKIHDMMSLFGQKSIMTRTKDEMLCYENVETIRERKRIDIQNRVDTINNTENGVLISIHQNYYPSSEPCGAQVLYNSKAQELAELLQSQIVSVLDPSNYRPAAKCSDDIYLMAHSNKPSLLIECGFLSNPSDKGKLMSDDYRLKLASVITCCIMSYYYDMTY